MHFANSKWFRPGVWLNIVAMPALLFLLIGNPAPAAEPAPRWPGLQADGETLLFNQWSITPAGQQITLGSFPVNLALHPTEPWAAVLHAGFGQHEIVIVDLKRLQIVSREKLPQTFYGIAFDPTGKQLFASGGEFEVVHQFAFAAGKLSQHRVLGIADEKKSTWIPAGLATSRDGATLFVAGAFGGAIARVPLANPKHVERLEFEKGSYPLAVLPSRDGRRLYVSLWGQSAVAVVDLAAWRVEKTWPTGLPALGSASSHPTEMALSPEDKLLYVACANSNSVTVFDTATGHAVEQISSALEAHAPPGSTPSSLALSADGKVLLVANADNNDVAMLDVSVKGHSRSLGFIPGGWYPTSVRFGVADQRIYMLNGKGVRTKNNSPEKDPPTKQIRDEYDSTPASATPAEPTSSPQPPISPKPPAKPIPKATAAKEPDFPYIGSLYQGTLAVIDPPSPADMARYSRQALAGNPMHGGTAAAASRRAADNPIPARVGDRSPIKHCIYIIKENRTYDQVFGDVKEGNGDPRLCLFDRHVTPNHHALAAEFVLLDNFYANAEVSAQGHEWSTAAYCTDFVEKAWPLAYRGGALDKIPYPSEGKMPLAFPAAGYLWDRCQQAGVSYRSYGEFIDNGPPGQPSHTNLKTLQGHFDPQYHGWDLDYPDVKRTDRFLEELRGYEQSGKLPRFIILRLPNDHTMGSQLGKPTPSAMVADNDLALGRLVEGVSHSRYWADMAIFVVEDDAQDGPDHVDAHRTVALAISPYCRRHTVDSTLYSTTSMVRTIGLILGLEPLSQFDEAAAPMYGSFQAKLDPTPYMHRPAEMKLTAVNERGAWGAETSAKFDFSHEDAVDDLLFGEIVWRSVRGADSPMPAPVHAAFVRTRTPQAAGVKGAKDDDDN
jgi:DNA-binding beta-propeller fold protein YncE